MRIINAEDFPMRRLNITLPDEVARALNRVANKSRFITEAVMEKMAEEDRRKLDADLSEGYLATRAEDARVDAEWETATTKDWP
jgi:hypothetical protein